VKKIKYFITLIILLVATLTFAQKGSTVINKESNWQDRIYFGGGFGLQGGSWGTSISLSPIVGYMVNSRLSVGVGATYQYYKYKDSFYDYSDNRYGGQVFARVNLIKQIFAYGHYSFLNYSFNGNENDRRTVYRLPLGLGMSQPIGSRSSLNFLAAYDVLYENNGPYASPWVFSIFFSI
jgi:outer membrane protein assembly factor BamA